MTTKNRLARKADMEAMAWSVTCPACGADLASPNGSLMWTLEDRAQPLNRDCGNCGQNVRIPEAK